MDAIRTLVLKQDKSFLAAKQAYEKQDVFTMEGDFYKRVRYPEQPQDIQDWLQRKGISFNHNSKDFHLLFSPELHSTVAQHFRLLAPVYAFFCGRACCCLRKRAFDPVLLFCENSSRPKWTPMRKPYLKLRSAA